MLGIIECRRGMRRKEELIIKNWVLSILSHYNFLGLTELRVWSKRRNIEDSGSRDLERLRAKGIEVLPVPLSSREELNTPNLIIYEPSGSVCVMAHRSQVNHNSNTGSKQQQHTCTLGLTTVFIR